MPDIAKPDVANQLMRSSSIHGRVTQVFQHRTQHAREQYMERVHKALTGNFSETASHPLSLWELATSWQEYATDFYERSVLFWDTLRQRGQQYIARELAGKPPVLHFDYEMVLDARRFERPVNYALVRITPPPGVKVDSKRRPYVIIDPRPGHRRLQG